MPEVRLEHNKDTTVVTEMADETTKPEPEKHRNRLISRKMVHEFVAAHPGTERDLEVLIDWCKAVEKADWRNFSDVRQSYTHADQIGRLTCFNVGGNKYRVLAFVLYRSGTSAMVYLQAILTHKEYDKLDMK